MGAKFKCTVNLVPTAATHCSEVAHGSCKGSLRKTSTAVFCSVDTQKKKAQRRKILYQPDCSACPSYLLLHHSPPFQLTVPRRKATSKEFPPILLQPWGNLLDRAYPSCPSNREADISGFSQPLRNEAPPGHSLVTARICSEFQCETPVNSMALCSTTTWKCCKLSSQMTKLTEEATE